VALGPVERRAVIGAIFPLSVVVFTLEKSSLDGSAILTPEPQPLRTEAEHLSAKESLFSEL